MSESIGTLRADLRRIELTMGARIDARVGASESALRDEIDRLGRELDRLGAEIREQIEGIRGEVRTALDLFSTILHGAAPHLGNPGQGGSVTGE
jgi:hypothetical protein